MFALFICYFVFNKFIYLLSYNKDRPYLMLEFSANTDLVQWVISTNPSDEKNEFSFIDNVTVNGKNMITIELTDTILKSNPKIYLIVLPII